MNNLTSTNLDNEPPQLLATIFIVEDDKLLAEYLVVLLESAHFNVKTYTSPQEFFDGYQPAQHGCVISDMLMPGMTGLEMLQNFSNHNISLPVIFMTAHADVSMVKTALKLGAVDFLEKPLNTIELLIAIQDALSQNVQIRSRQQKVENTHSRLSELTGREREILDLLVAGQSNKQLAKQLNLSLRTIETHRNNILKKMGVSSFTELLRVLLSSSGKVETK